MDSGDEAFDSRVLIDLQDEIVRKNQPMRVRFAISLHPFHQVWVVIVDSVYRVDVRVDNFHAVLGDAARLFFRVRGPILQLGTSS